MTTDAYLASVDLSADRLRGDLTDADQAFAAAMEAAHRGMLASQRNRSDIEDRNRAQALAGDNRQSGYDRAFQAHFDRRTALARHFGQFWIGPGSTRLPPAFADGAGPPLR